MPTADTAETLLETLRHAFNDVTVPSDAELVYSDRHWAEVETLLEPTWRNWSEVPSEKLMGSFDVLCFLSPTAFRFYLAAFLHAVLSDWERNAMLAEYARYWLPPGTSTGRELTESDPCFNEFTSQQMDVVRRFVTYFDRVQGDSS